VPVLTDALTGQVGGQVLARLTPHKSRQMVLLIEGRREDLRSADLCPPPLINCLNAGTTRSDRMRLSAGLSFDQHMWGDRLLFSPALQVLVAGSTFSPLAGAVGAATPLSSTSTFASPRIGTRLRLWPGVVVRASAGRFVRLPTFLELFGDGAFFRQDLTLQPESAWSLEAGTRAEGERRGLRYLVEVNGFYRLVDNLIETLRDGPTLSARNVGSARMEGVETEVRGAFRDFLSVRLSYTYLDARDQTEVTGHAGNLLPGRPQHSVFLRGDAGYGPWRAFYELDYTSLLYLDPANLDPRPERTLHGVGVQLGPYRLPGGGRYTLLAELRNLLDTRLLQVPKNLSPNGQPGFVPLGDYLDYPLPGRALYATLSAER
jgi:iron complex outermembrane receptor protein